jgi:hypothetical protein
MWAVMRPLSSVIFLLLLSGCRECVNMVSCVNIIRRTSQLMRYTYDFMSVGCSIQMGMKLILKVEKAKRGKRSEN